MQQVWNTGSVHASKYIHSNWWTEISAQDEISQATQPSKFWNTLFQRYSYLLERKLLKNSCLFYDQVLLSGIVYRLTQQHMPCAHAFNRIVILCKSVLRYLTVVPLKLKHWLFVVLGQGTLCIHQVACIASTCLKTAFIRSTSVVPNISNPTIPNPLQCVHMFDHSWQHYPHTGESVLTGPVLLVLLSETHQQGSEAQPCGENIALTLRRVSTNSDSQCNANLQTVYIMLLVRSGRSDRNTHPPNVSTYVTPGKRLHTRCQVNTTSSRSAPILPSTKGTISCLANFSQCKHELLQSQHLTGLARGHRTVPSGLTSRLILTHGQILLLSQVGYLWAANLIRDVQPAANFEHLHMLIIPWS